MPTTCTILLAEDDDQLRELLASQLRLSGHDVIEARDGKEVQTYLDDCILRDIPRQRAHVLVSDIRMPGLNGLRLLAYARDLGWSAPTILITAFGDEETRKLAARLGATAVLDKPFSIEEMSHAIDDATNDQTTC